MNINEFLTDDLDVQKAVVESLAADKAEQDVKIEAMQEENMALRTEIGQLKSQIEKLNKSLAEASDILVKNSEATESNQVTLLERSEELGDKFVGETRDHVLEAIKEAYEKAEKEGRLRKAQILESVMVANEPSGNLEAKRTSLERLFIENGNILTGQVIKELDKLAIQYKNGEEYLLSAEIIKRNY